MWDHPHQEPSMSWTMALIKIVIYGTTYSSLQFGISMIGKFETIHLKLRIHWAMFQLPLPRPLPRLCIHALISTTEKFLACFAVKCSSWSAINQGTSRRAPCASLGLAGYPSVDSANTMASRTLVFDFNLYWQILNFQGSELYRSIGFWGPPWSVQRLVN